MLSTSRHKQLNLHGAVHTENPSDLIVLACERIDAASTIALFERLEQQHPNGRLHGVCGNASYYRSTEVRRWLKGRCHSPNLNLIERVWKYLRHTVIDTTYYTTFGSFSEAILGFFTNSAEHHYALRSLLAPNFHIELNFAI